MNIHISTNITATGAGKDSDITIQGSTVNAGANVKLKADDAVNLLAARNEEQTQSNNSSSSASLGVSYAVQSGGLGINIAASKGKGNGDGSSTSYTNTSVNAGNKLTIESGGDTNLLGATASGKSVVAKVGGNLTIESLQDTSTYAENQKNSGANLSLSAAGVPTGGSISAGRTNINSNYQSVGTQSGILAGDGGFQVEVKGDTTLKGGAITSTQVAIDSNKNSFQTGGVLSLSDLQNSAAYSASSASATVGVGSGLGSSGAGVGRASGDASSTTTAGISGVAGDQAKRTGDAQTGIKPIFDKETVKQDVQAQVQITTAFGQQASKAVGDYGSKKLQEEVKLREDANKETDPTKRQAMLAEADTIHDNWKEGGSLRVLSHTLVGGLTGNLQGALGAVSTQTIVPMLGEEIAKLDMPTELKETLLQTAAIAVGGATGGSAGAAAGLNATAQNYLNHVNAEALAKLKEQQQSGKCDTACKTEITRLETLDKLTNKQLADCTGVSSSACDAVRSDVRAAAASYIRATNKPISVVYQQEQSEANSLAQSTMDGKTKGVGLGVVETVVGAGTAMYKAGVALGNIILQDPVILQQIKNAAPAVWGYVSDPENWPTMLGAMSATQREELAKAYERGDGQAVGKMMVATFASLPVGGGFGTIKKITTVADDAAIGAKVVSKSEKIIEVNVGSKSNWDKTINTDLKPNTQYKLSTGHTYVTDDVGRVNQASGDLNQTTMDRNAYQQGCVGKCVNPTGDDGGHLIASSLGGAGDRINMVPQASTLNRGDWKAMENQLRDELKAGKSVNFKVDLGYPNVTTPRPSTFKIIAIIDGKEKVWRFTQ